MNASNELCPERKFHPIPQVVFIVEGFPFRFIVRKSYWGIHMRTFILGVILASLYFLPFFANASNGKLIRSNASNDKIVRSIKPKAPPATLSILQDSGTGKLVVSWSGKGVLKKAPSLNGQFQPVKRWGSRSQFVIESADAESGVYRLDSADGGVFSHNIVGYVNIQLPPGLSLIQNPLFFATNTVALWWPDAPDGSQILKYVAGSGYEVSTFDGISKTWSNPDLDIPIGEGFYFRNSFSETIVNTFVGEVRQGFLTNTLPAGYSMKGSLVPQTGSINSVHGIPGEAGDEIRTLTNISGVETQNISTFDGALNQWVPDLILHVGESFWIHKQHQQDWVRYFSANN